MYKKVLGMAIISASMLMVGCAGFKANKLPQVKADDLHFASAKKTKVFSRWNIESHSSLANEQAKAMGAALHKKYFDDAIKATDCCIIVEGPNDADVVVDGKAVDENNPAAVIPAFITGLSLFTIPSWMTAKVHIYASAKTNTAAKSYELQDSVTMVQWLPMIIAMPFTGTPIKAGKEVDENTYKNLVLNMKNDGLFQ